MMRLLITGLALAVALVLPALAGAVTLSTGDVILGTDQISSIQLAADSGGGVTIDYDSVTQKLAITASVSTINFVGGGQITGIPTGDIWFSSTLDLVGAPLFLPFFDPAPTFASLNFQNGLVADFTITDLGTGGAGLLMAADYNALLNVTIQDGATVKGELSGTFDVLGSSNTDFKDAFGTEGEFDSLITFGSTTACSLGIFDCTGPLPALDDWSGNPTSTLVPTATVPEPTAILLPVLAAVGLLATRRTSR